MNSLHFFYDEQEISRFPIRSIVAAGILILIFSLLFWYSDLLLKNSPPTIRPAIGTAILAVYGTGEVEPVIWAKLSAALPGRLTKFYAVEGDIVKSGKLLAHLDDSVEQATLKEMVARLHYYEHERDRKAKLADRNITSQLSLEQAVSFHEQFLARVQAQRELINRLAIKSPIDGVVLRRDGELGELIEKGQNVFWVGQPENLQIVATIDEEDIAGVEPGQAVLVKAVAFPNKIIQGHVSDITLKEDPIFRNFGVKISLPQDSKLLVGMTVEINVIIRSEPKAILVPSASVFEGQVYRKDGRHVRVVPVETGINSGEKIQILSGFCCNEHPAKRLKLKFSI